MRQRHRDLLRAEMRSQRLLLHGARVHGLRRGKLHGEGRRSPDVAPGGRRQRKQGGNSIEKKSHQKQSKVILSVLYGFVKLLYSAYQWGSRAAAVAGHHPVKHRNF